MHVYFSGIGGAGIGPLALIAKQAGYEVSGSDLKDSQYVEYIRKHGIQVSVGQTRQQIAADHEKQPIDWFVYTSALPPDHPELEFCAEKGIKHTKRDEFLSQLLKEKSLKLIAVAGTHGKTTTTAMAVWVFKQLDLPVSYSVGAKLSFGDMGDFNSQSEYFVYEADEFDRNFLAFRPYLTVIPGLAYDHHEIYKTKDEYIKAFEQIISQSRQTIMWDEDAKLLDESSNLKITIEQGTSPEIDNIQLAGKYNRRDAWLVARALHQITGRPMDQLTKILSAFPGLSRRFEKVADNIYSDYAHTPEKIQGVMSVVRETAAKTGQKVVIIYEPLTNRRMHYTAANHRDVFNGASQIYWVPSYLAREDPNQKVLTPTELIKNLNPELQRITEPAELNEDLAHKIMQHAESGDLVVALSGGGGGSLDEWLRQNLESKSIKISNDQLSSNNAQQST